MPMDDAFSRTPEVITAGHNCFLYPSSKDLRNRRRALSPDPHTQVTALQETPLQDTEFRRGEDR